MKKEQLRADLAGRAWCESLIGDETLIGSPHDGITEYEQSVLEVTGDAAIGRSIRYYVRDEGGVDEVAWYKHSEPVATINVGV
jgi:hypothetical protein